MTKIKLTVTQFFERGYRGQCRQRHLAITRDIALRGLGVDKLLVERLL